MPVNPNFIPPQTDDAELANALRILAQYLGVNFRELARLAEGRISSHVSADTAAPTGGLWAQGDFVRNSEPATAGTASSQYVVLGWVCTTGGTPGTWVECRTLTGT